MRASAITLLIATGLWATACGSGSSPSNAGPTPPLENGEYQKPPSSYQDPPSTGQPSDYEKPPSTYERPGGSGVLPPPKPGANPCDHLCAMAEAQDCASELDNQDSIAALPLPQCLTACKEKFDGYSCQDDLTDLSNCILEHVDGLDCNQLERIGNGDLNNIPRDARDACTDRINDLVGCLEDGDNPPPNGGSCTISGKCICDDACQSCRCENLGDDGPCTDCRPMP